MARAGGRGESMKGLEYHNNIILNIIWAFSASQSLRLMNPKHFPQHEIFPNLFKCIPCGSSSLFL